jgi:DNA-binding CsgD family transcriptional regulator
MGQLDQGVVSRAIQQIYDAAINPQVWHSFLEETVSNLNGTAGFMIMLDIDNPAKTLSFQSQFPEEVYMAYLRDFYLDGDLWYQASLKRSSGETFIGSECIDDKTLTETPFYNICLEPMDAGRMVACAVDSSTDKTFGISISRPFNKKDFDSCDKQYFDLLAPHLTRARFLHNFLLESEQEKLALHDALHKTTTALILLNQNKKMIFVNHSAEIILKHSDEVMFINSSIRFRNHANQKKFDQYFSEANCTAKADGHFAGGSLKVINSLGKPTYHIIITPLNLSTDNTQLHAGAAVGVFIIDPESRHPLSTTLLQGLYDLSPAETKLTQLLFKGIGLSEICEINSVKMSTVKSQLRKVFEKTGTSSQSELMRILAQGIGLISDN